ncbi:MAG: hypothetical protein U5K43_15625 [Halofilum sp. (in: g-proteobacteria)]|nr:hypothetical protein [Halofilum sp. (in: g-proteobacteria)]
MTRRRTWYWPRHRSDWSITVAMRRGRRRIIMRFLHGPLRARRMRTREAFVIEPGSLGGSASPPTLAGRRPARAPAVLPRRTARLTGAAAKIQAGEYAIDTRTTPYRLLKKFVAGDVKHVLADRHRGLDVRSDDAGDPGP